MRILFIGPQGSGKSTQGKLLSKHLKLPYFSTGDIFRSKSSENSDEGKRIREILQSGRLVDDQATCQLVKQKLSDKDSFIMDGYPRNLEQLNTFDPKFDIVFYLQVSKDELIKRLVNRGRSDDTHESIKVRLDNYFQQTEPLLNHFRERGILKEIDGVENIKEIQRGIISSF